MDKTLQNLVEKLILKDEFFDINNNIHNKAHTYRVMCHIITLSERVGQIREGSLAMCAAFLHDMARTDSGFCKLHNKWAAEVKLPQYEEFFFECGVSRKDREEIRVAINFHSIDQELDRFHPFAKTTAILKDADALDRFRYGDDDFDAKFLRYKTSLQLIDFGRHLYIETKNNKDLTLLECLRIRDEFFAQQKEIEALTKPVEEEGIFRRVFTRMFA
ncbi:MAG: HD domain-containing protein [Bacteroidota bacterium]|nr:HD domain-containing protein [Bacteroidota bacterium]